MSIVLKSDWFEPSNNTNSDDMEAAIRMTDFTLGWFANPIFSADGDYPQSMKNLVTGGRLPSFTQDEINSIKGFKNYLILFN